MKIIYNKDYGITRHPIYHKITNLYCKYCDFIVWRPLHGSGLAKYNKMRGEMVKHLHSNHLGELGK